MRSRKRYTISSREVHGWCLQGLLGGKLLKNHGLLCTAGVVLNLVLRAAARSVLAVCRDLAKGPSDQAVMTALGNGLPKTLKVLERRLNEALTASLCVDYRRHRNRKDGKQVKQKLLFAVWCV